MRTIVTSSLSACVLALLGCAPDLRPLGEPVVQGAATEQRLPDGRALRVSIGGELTLHSTRHVRMLAHEVLPQLALDRLRGVVVYARRPPAGGELWAASIDGPSWRRRLTSGGAACLPALSVDGRHVAFVDTSPQGLASVFVVPIAGGRPRQLTNVGLRARGSPPPGFVPPPDGPTDLTWDGDAVVLRGRVLQRVP